MFDVDVRDRDFREPERAPADTPPPNPRATLLALLDRLSDEDIESLVRTVMEWLQARRANTPKRLVGAERAEASDSSPTGAFGFRSSPRT